MGRYPQANYSRGFDYLLRFIFGSIFVSIFGGYIFPEAGLFAPILGLILTLVLYFSIFVPLKWFENKAYQSKFNGDEAIFKDIYHEVIKISKEKIVYSNHEINKKDIIDIRPDYTNVEMIIVYSEKSFYGESHNRNVYLRFLDYKEKKTFLKALREIGFS